MWQIGRFRQLVMGVLVLLMAAPAFAQDIRDMQLFAPANLSSYGRGIQPREGFFFNFDFLGWYISPPEQTTVGFSGLTRTAFYGPLPADAIIQTNTLNTSFLNAEPTEGQRIEFGRITSRRGWFVSTYRLVNQTENRWATDVPMVFVDDEFGAEGSKLLEGLVSTDPDVIRDLPIFFDEVEIRNSVEHWSVELMAIHRFRQNHNGGFFEVFAGVRYMEFDDFFGVDARGEGEVIGEGDGEEPEEPEEPEPELLDPEQVGAILADSIWNTTAENHLIGPQIGMRWFRQRGRWVFSTEGRYMAGFNFQNIFQQGALGTELTPPGGLGEPLLMAPTSFNHAEHPEEYSNVAELKAELWYQCTRAVSFRVGWSGLWMDGIGRASNLINYEVPNMGLRTQFNQQDVFVHGLNFGIIFNR